MSIKILLFGFIFFIGSAFWVWIGAKDYKKATHPQPHEKIVGFTLGFLTILAGVMVFITTGLISWTLCLMQIGG